tara:strand:+ start:1641 stop:1958 length:318 start_codon:yes stop_codon:yes gene_type:complete
MAIYFKDEYASPTQMYGPRAYVTANGSTVIASSGLSSLANSSTGRYMLNYSFTYPDAHAAVAVLPDNNYHDQSWYDTNETGRVQVNFFHNNGYEAPNRWSAIVLR